MEHPNHYTATRGTRIFYTYQDKEDNKAWKIGEVYCIAESFTLGVDADATTQLSCIQGHTFTVSGTTTRGEMNLTLYCLNSDKNQQILASLFEERPKQILNFVICDSDFDEEINAPDFDTATGKITPPANRTSASFTGTITEFEDSYQKDLVKQINIKIARQSAITRNYKGA